MGASVSSNRRQSQDVPLQRLNIHLNCSSLKIVVGVLANLLEKQNPEVGTSEKNGRHTNHAQRTQQLLHAADGLAVGLLNLVIDIAKHSSSFRHEGRQPQTRLTAAP
jgi:hypothetical protein